jgi:Domain of unknown function (DUF6602)
MTPHELETFLEQDLIEMRSEYDRIRARTREDPETAGDEGEEAWAAVLREWLPSSYQIRLKGRILGADGAAGPQVDIVVLRPGYPKRLLDKKLYLAGGVAAVFECKNTLTAAHIVKTWQNVEAVNALEGAVGEETPFRALVPTIFYGLLAHGHSWDKPRSDPAGIITGKVSDLVNSTDRMRDVLSLICVANLASWDVFRMTYDGPGLFAPDLWEARKQLLGISSDEASCSLQYNLALSNVEVPEPSNPVGVLVAGVIGRLAFSDSTLRPLSQYFYAAGMGGRMGVAVVSRRFPVESQFSAETISRLPHSLTNAQAGSEWSMGFNF